MQDNRMQPSTVSSLPLHKRTPYRHAMPSGTLSPSQSPSTTGCGCIKPSPTLRDFCWPQDSATVETLMTQGSSREHRESLSGTGSGFGSGSPVKSVHWQRRRSHLDTVSGQEGGPAARGLPAGVWWERTPEHEKRHGYVRNRAAQIKAVAVRHQAGHDASLRQRPELEQPSPPRAAIKRHATTGSLDCSWCTARAVGYSMTWAVSDVSTRRSILSRRLAGNVRCFDK